LELGSIPPSAEGRARLRDVSDPRDVDADGGAPLDAAAAAVGDRWALLVVDALRPGPLRFADLAARVPGVAPNVLTRRLRDLQAAGIVAAEPYSERPLRHRYVLTALGRDLSPALAALARWGEQLLEATVTDPADADDEDLRYA
jgi:DNA-binding HxlR family transcriptional regulator